MGFLDEYEKALDAEKKKKKKKQKETRTFMDDYRDTLATMEQAEQREPILPTASVKDEKKWYEGYLQWGDALKDGYQFGDVTKTLLATNKDIATNLLTGVVGWGENIVDAGATAIGTVSELLGKTETADKMRELAMKDLYDEKKVSEKILMSGLGILGPVSMGVGHALRGVVTAEDLVNLKNQDNSILGDESDALVESAGETLAKIGLTAAAGGFPVGDIITGVTVYGEQAEQALKEGATFSEATGSGLISAGAEIMFEKLSGGIKIGGATLDEGLTRLVSKNISNVALKTAVNLGLDVAGEAGEEVLTEFVGKLGTALYKEEDLGQILFSEQALQDYIKAAFGGGLMGGVFNVPGAVSGVSSGVDYKTGLNQNEQSVLNREIENRIAELEESGEKVTKAQQNKIYEEARNDLEKGYISTDTIESVLAAEKYQPYKEMLDEESAIREELKGYQTEYDSLSKKDNLTLEETVRKNELTKLYTDAKAKLDDKDRIGKRDYLKAHLNQEVYEMTKGDRLRESYFERVRASQKFEADVSKYKGKAKEVIQRVVDSGLVDNTNRMHEFWDAAAKISEDKGIDISVATNDQILDMIEEEARADGREFDRSVFDGKIIDGVWTKNGIVLNPETKRALNFVVGHEITHSLEASKQYEALQKVLFGYGAEEYQKRFNERSGQYKNIYTDGKFRDKINKEIAADMVGDYLFTDYEFIRQLSTQNRNVFQRIWDEVKYLYKAATAGSKEARELEKVKRAFEKAYREANKAQGDAKLSVSDSDGKQLTKEQQDFFKDSKVRDENGNLKVMYHGSQDAGFHVFDARMSDDDISFFFVDRNDVAASYSGTTETYEAKTIRSAEDMNNFLAEIGYGEDYEVVQKDGQFILLYDGDRVAASDTAQGIYKEFCWYEGVGEGDANYKVYLNLTNPLEVDGKGRPWNKIDAEFSQEVYDKYSSLTAEEKDALIDLAEWEDFRLFNSEVQEARGNALASAYEKMGEDCNIYDLFSVAADNFSDEAMRENSRRYLKTRDYAQRAKEQGYDGVIFRNIVDNGGYSNGSEGASTVAIAFESNQIKSVANEKPTKDADIRYSVSEDSEGRKLSPAVAKRFSNSKAIDENGNLKVLYHGTASGEFFIFDKTKGSVEGDYGSGFYFTDDSSDVENNYEGGGPDFENKVSRRAEEIYGEEDIDYEEAERRARAELYKGSHKFEVYLNIENPAIVGKTILFEPDSYWGQYDQEDYDNEDDYYGDVEQLVADDIDNIIWEVEQNVDVDSTDGIADILWGAFNEGGIDLERLKARINGLYLEDSNGDLVGNEVARQIVESLGYDGIIDPTVSTKWNMNMRKGTTHYIVFKPNQIKNVTNQNPTEDPDIRHSISDKGQTFKPQGRWNVYNQLPGAADIAPVPAIETAPVETAPAEVAPEVAVPETPGEEAPVAPATENMFPDDLAPVSQEIDSLIADRDMLMGALESAQARGDASALSRLAQEYEAVNARVRELEGVESERTGSLTDADVPPEMEAPMNIEDAYPDNQPVQVGDPFADRDWYEAKNLTSIMEEIPSLKPFIMEEALNMLQECSDSIKGERFYNDDVYYESGGEKGWTGVKRHTSEDIAEILDGWNIGWDALERGLRKIGFDGEAKTAVPKKLEFMLNQRLLHGYKDMYTGKRVGPNQGYIAALREHQNLKHYEEERNSFFESADQYAPPAAAEDIAPAPLKPTEAVNTDSMKGVVKGQESYITQEDKLRNRHPQQGPEVTAPLKEYGAKQNPKVANVLTEEPAIAKEKSGIFGKMVSALVDKGSVFEKLSMERDNHEIQAKWNYALPSNTEARAQYYMEHGEGGVKPLKDILDVVNDSGKKDSFFDYMYQWLNVDRMTLDQRFGIPNMTVYGDPVTADVSRQKIARYEKVNPEFKIWAEKFYAITKDMRKKLVEGQIISQKTADWWAEKYPHYVPIGRVDTKGQNISVPLDTNKTGVNNPVKKAKGGNSDLRPLDVVLAERIEQTYRAIARNSFGIELKNTLGTTIAPQKKTQDKQTEAPGQMTFLDVDEAIETIESQDEKLLKPGTMYSNPTFTVFENGERVEFEITEDMYEALKPTNKVLAHRFQNSNNAAVRAVGKTLDARRNLLTNWNPVFALYRNPVKDLQDVAVNSQHAVKTYLNIPNAIIQLATNGEYATEYHQNGGKSNTYFDNRKKQFNKDGGKLKKFFGMYSLAGEYIEEIPRLAEYIASRKEHRSVERSMLDAARVTTNFAAGGDFTKFLNSHGFTFLNASVQGAAQHVRNFREGWQKEGILGVTKTLAKYVVAGLPTILLNGLLWDDDEEYEELSDYVKQNYYVVAKTQDGKFVRIPKGRTAAVMGELAQQMVNLVTGNDEVDFATFSDLFWSNIAPNNPVENSIFAPIRQVRKNEAWYGGDLVPSRLQDLPAEEQYDESTDILSKWLGENFDPFGLGPYKINYLIDQYSGGIGDMLLPMLTPEAESGDDSLLGNLLAPWKKEITTDKVLNNKYPGDFYDLRDELEVIANGKNATEEDAMRSMYMDSVSWDMSDLYKQKREIQSSDMTDSEKYEAVREIQEKINALAESAMSGYNDVSVNGLYAEVGDRRYNKDAESGKWYEIQETNADGTANYYYKKEQEVTKGLGISYEQYWNNREEYNYAYDKPEQYALSQAVGGYQAYRGYTSELWDIKADKDENGKSISGSRKEKVIDYLNNLDIDYYHKIILFKNEYNADDTYNQEIIDYLNSNDDISYEEMESILKYLGFEVDEHGNIWW